MEKRCHTEPTLLMVHAFIFDVITCCKATYAARRKTITNRNAGYAGLKLAEANFVLGCRFKLLGAILAVIFQII